MYIILAINAELCVNRVTPAVLDYLHPKCDVF